MEVPVPKESSASRKKRKEEARRLKRKRIEEGGGVRPRKERTQPTGSTKAPEKNTHSEKRRNFHRFGRVMERVPCRNKPRQWTVSIAVPGSVVSNCQTKELKTQLVGQIARAAAIYHVDEIVVFDDKLSVERRSYGRQQRRDYRRDRRDQGPETDDKEVQQPGEGEVRRSDPHTFMARVLQYCECPQYLRRKFFPMHPDLQFAGLLCPLDAPHHVRADDRCKYREGVVMDGKGPGKDGGSMVNCGIWKRPVEIDRVLTPGIRCTVEIDLDTYAPGKQAKGKVVSPSAPREDDGTYWGYTTRMASSLNAVFDECPFGEYDLKIGTSERGDLSVDSVSFSLPSFNHALVLFGGVAGIEECVDADENMKISGSHSRNLFDVWVNVCKFQGSRTIRTEEAVLISLARLSPFLSMSKGTPDNDNKEDTCQEGTESNVFSDEAPSDESSV